jgi:hypothetical protein
MKYLAATFAVAWVTCAILLLTPDVEHTVVKYAKRSIKKNYKSVPFKSNIKNDTYRKHINAAVSKGVTLINNDASLNSSVRNNKLVKVRGSVGYKVQPLTHSYGFLTPQTKSVLDNMGQEFSNRTGTYFTLTSLTRTVVQQKKLTKSNSNATKNTSSHSYGVSFDISYVRVHGCSQSFFQRELQVILKKYQSSGKILVIKESRQRCYHVTVKQ